MDNNRLIAFSLIVALVWVCGCGSNTAQQNGNASAKKKNRRGAAAPSAPVVQKQGVKKRKPAQPAPKQDDLLAAADPEDVFEISSEQPNFTIVADGPDTFLATVPPKGVDSSQFAFEAPPADDSSSTPPNRDLKLPQGFVVLEEFGYSEEGLPLRIHCEKDDAIMALIPSSISTQGSNDGPPDAAPEIAVFLDPYYIDLTEVTLEQYERYRSWSRENKKRTPERPVNSGSVGDRPALGISWADARNYAEWSGKQLPTEAEWEKAARGAEGFPHPWGYGRAGWSPPRTLQQIDPVQSFRADISSYGVFDMAGNAREWCDDHYAADAYREATKDGETVVRNWPGPKRASIANHRVVKGNGPDWLLWHRWPVHMREGAPDVGFRCVLRGVLPSDGDEPEKQERKGVTRKKTKPKARRKTGF